MKTKSGIAWILLALGSVSISCGEEPAAPTPQQAAGGATPAAATPPGAGAAEDPLPGDLAGPLRAVYRRDGVAFQPDDPAWDEVPPRLIVLIAQMIAPPNGGGATSKLSARAMHDGEWLAVRLQWQDQKPDQAVGVSTFRDSVAIGFPTAVGDRLPSPFMGEETMPVDIWQWTADFDANARGHGSFGDVYPHTAGVWYFPQDDMVTRQVRAWRGSEPVIELEARGFGSLERKSMQNVRGAGIHDGRLWSVVLRRRLDTGRPNDVRFRPGDSSNAIFAVWDGTSDEVNGKKSITPVWTALELDDTRVAEEER